MKKNRILSLSFLILAAVAPVYASSYEDAYTLPLHNNENVDLPEWVKTELADINAELRDKLSPIDYLEILKGEYFLFSKYPTRKQYNKNYAKDTYETPCRDINECKKKLREILKNPNDIKVFTRAYVPHPTQEGIYFRDHLRYSAGSVFFTHAGGILTRMPGETDAYASILTCWDPRTAREIGSISLPTFTGLGGNAVCSPTPDGANAYYVHYMPAEAYSKDWSGNYFGAYIWIPEKGDFQRLLSIDFDTISTLKAYSKSHTGDIYQSLGLRPGAISTTNTEAPLPGAWFRSKEAGMHELGSALSTQQDSRDIYVTAHSDGAMLMLTRTFDRIGRTPSGKSFTYGINFDTLEIQRTRVATEEERKKDVDILLNKLRRAMIPNPISGGDGETCDLLNEQGYDPTKRIERGTCHDGYTPFALLYGHFDEGSSMPSSIVGIQTPNNKVYLYEWKSLKNGQSGELIPYENCITTGVDGNLIYSVQEMFTPYIRHHSVRLSDDGSKAEIVIISEWDDGRAYTTILDVDTSDYSYTVKHRFDSPQKPLCPVWIPEKQWFLEPVSDVCYHIKKVNKFGVLEKLADLYVDPNRGYAIVLPDGTYAGSPGCESFLAFREGNQTVGMETLAPWKNRPAEVLAALGGNEDDIAALRETTKRWLRKLHMTDRESAEAPSLESLPVAKVELPDLFTDTRTLTISVQLQAPQNKALTAAEVYAEGKRIPQEWDDSLQVLPGEEKTVTVQVPLAVGQNWLEIRPVDSMGVAGDTTKFRVILEDVTQASELYMVALGVSDYENDHEEMKDLRYAVKDAQDITNCFTKHAKGKIHTLVLKDNEVYDISVLQKVKDFFAGSKMNDRVILYVAGHGFLDENLDYRYATAGFDADRMEETGIPMDALVDAIKSAPARKGLLLLDTCHSGTLGEAGEEALAKNSPEHTDNSRNKRTRGMKLRGTGKVLTTERQNKRYIEDMFSTGSAYRGINIIAGAAGAELAQEGDEWNNGVFTAGIMQTLDDMDTADSNADSILSVAELQNNVVQLVQKYTNGKQKPTVVTAEDNPMNIIEPNVPWLSEVKQRIADYDTSPEQKNTDWRRVREWAQNNTDADAATEVMLALAEYNMPTDIYSTLLQAGVDADDALRAAAKSNNIANMERAFSEGASAATATECLTSGYGYDFLRCLQRHGADLKAKGSDLFFGKPGTNMYNGYARNALSPQEAQTLTQCLKLILDSGVDANIQDSKGNTALHLLLQYPTPHSVPIIDVLLLAGADPNIRNNEGRRPQEPGDSNYRYLQQRAELLRNTPNVAEVSLGNGGNREQVQQYLNIIQNYRATDSTMKLYKKRLSMLLPMIINGADVNVTTAETKGNTALHYAAGMGYYDLVVWLVQNGAEVNRKTNRGKTPLDCVGNDPNNNVRNFLKNNGAVKSN